MVEVGNSFWVNGASQYEIIAHTYSVKKFLSDLNMGSYSPVRPRGAGKRRLVLFLVLFRLELSHRHTMSIYHAFQFQDIMMLPFVDVGRCWIV
jgi:hypothetical protein